VTFFHFTSIHHLPFIIGDGFLNVTDPYLDQHNPHAGPPVVWLLDEPEVPEGIDVFERVLAHGISVEKRRIRFEVECKGAIRWLDWAPARQMDPEWRDIQIRTGGGIERAEHWYVKPAPVWRKHWVRIEDLEQGVEVGKELAAS
jgi:hypothetical protein